jgi:hypothetical protein
MGKQRSQLKYCVNEENFILNIETFDKFCLKTGTKPQYLYNYTKNYINKTGILFQWHT